MPRKEPFVGERLVVVARSIEHHFNDALDISVCGLECTDIDAEAAGNRGSDLFSVELLPLDFTAIENVGREGLQDGLLAEVESEGFHVADKPALPVPDGGQRFGEVFPVPGEPGPTLKVVDIHSTRLLRRL